MRYDFLQPVQRIILHDLDGQIEKGIGFPGYIIIGIYIPAEEFLGTVEYNNPVRILELESKENFLSLICLFSDLENLLSELLRAVMESASIK